MEARNNGVLGGRCRCGNVAAKCWKLESGGGSGGKEWDAAVRRVERCRIGEEATAAVDDSAGRRAGKATLQHTLQSLVRSTGCGGSNNNGEDGGWTAGVCVGGMDGWI
jgi:hypothetical protein